MGHYLSELESNERLEQFKPKKAKVYKSKSVEDLLKETTLKKRLEVLNDMMITCLLVDVNIIDSGYWNDKKEKKFGGFIRKQAKKMTKAQLKTVKEWEKDGRPK